MIEALCEIGLWCVDKHTKTISGYPIGLPGHNETDLFRTKRIAKEELIEGVIYVTDTDLNIYSLGEPLNKKQPKYLRQMGIQHT